MVNSQLKFVNLLLDCIRRPNFFVRNNHIVSEMGPAFIYVYTGY